MGVKPSVAEFSFVAQIQPRGLMGPWCHLFFPPAASDFLGRRGQVPIRLAVEGCEFRLAARPDGHGGHFIQFNREMRDTSAKRAGESVRVVIRVDTEPRPIVIPDELEAALDGAPEARAAWESLRASDRRAYAEFVAEAKGAPTRGRRATRALTMILAAPGGRTGARRGSRACGPRG